MNRPAQALWFLVSMLVLSVSIQVNAKNANGPNTLKRDQSTETNEQEVATSLPELKQRVEFLLGHYQVPGLSIAIVDKNREVWVAGVGLADKSTGLQVSSDSLFRTGSVSKLLVGLIALKTQDQGLIDLNARLLDIAPEVAVDNLWQESHPVRLIHLLEHTGGLPDLNMEAYAHNEPEPVKLVDFLSQFPELRVTRWRPGERFAYSNLGPALVAYVLEKKLGKPFEEIASEYLFAPLEMEGATYFQPKDPTLLVTNYQSGDAQPYAHIPLRPVGALNASARDLVNLLQVLSSGGEFNGQRIINKQTLAGMQIPSSSLAAKQGLMVGYGTTLMVQPSAKLMWYGHQGALPGALAEMSYQPENQFGYYLAINKNDPAALAALSKAVRLFLSHGAILPKIAETQLATPAVVDRYSGVYRLVNPRHAWQSVLNDWFMLKTIQINSQGVRVANQWSSESLLYQPVAEHLFRRDGRVDATLALFDDPDSPAMQIGTDYYQKIEPTKFYGWQAFSVVAVLALTAQWVLSLTVGIGYMSNKSVWRERGYISRWSIAAGLTALVYLVMLIFAAVSDPIKWLGTINLVNITVTWAPLTFFLLNTVSVVSLFALWRNNEFGKLCALNLSTNLLLLGFTIQLWRYDVMWPF